MALNYLLSPEFQIVNTAGKPNTGGYIETYIHGTRDRYYCASDFNGTLHPFKVPLDSLGSNVVLADDSHAYDVYVYNRYGTLLMSRYNVHPSEGGGVSSVNITSSDGSIEVTNTANGVDLSVNGSTQSVFVGSGDGSLTEDGLFTYNRDGGEGTDLSLVNNELYASSGWYGYSALVELDWAGPVRNAVESVSISCSGGQSQLVDFDLTTARTETLNVSGAYRSRGEKFICAVAGMPEGMTARILKLSVYRIASRINGGGGGGTEYTEGYGINISDDDQISVDTTDIATKQDLESKQDTLIAGDNITITDNVISATGGGSGIPGYDDLQFKLSTYEYPNNKSIAYTDDGKGVVCSYSLYGQGTSTAPSIDDATIRDKMCLGDGSDGVWFRLATQAGAFNGYGQAFTISRAMGAAGLRPILFKVSDPTVYYTFPNTVVPTWDGCATNPDGYQCGFVGKVMDASTHQEASGWKTVGQGMPYPAYSYWEILVHLTQSDMLDANGNQASVNLWYILQGLYGPYALGFYQPGTTGTFPNGCDGASWVRGVGSFADNASTYQIQPNLLQNKYAYFPELPNNYGVVIGGKTISTKSNSSDLEWVDLPQVDEHYSGFSFNAQSGFAVGEAISSVRQVPATTTALAGDVLAVAQDGNSIEWATPASGLSLWPINWTDQGVTIAAGSYAWPDKAVTLGFDIDPGEYFVGSIVIQSADFGASAPLVSIDIGYNCAGSSGKFNYVRVQGEHTYVVPVAISNTGSTSDYVGLVLNGTLMSNVSCDISLNGMLFSR